MANHKKVDNHFTADKVALRASMTAHLDRIEVLDVYGGHGVVWAAVERQTGKDISRTAIDNRMDLTAPHLHVDNLKVMQAMDLTEFNVIDIDAYGIPADRIRHVCRSGFKGTVFVTAIQTMQGQMPSIIRDDLGLPHGTPSSIVSRNGWEYFKAWLAGFGIEEITHRSWSRKHYLGFELT